MLFEKGKPLSDASKALILLHGRGASAIDILSLSDNFCDDSFYIAAPEAPNNTWYPYSFMVEENENEPWLSSAVETVKKLIDGVSRYVPKDKIYIMGFSQGACLTLEVSARHPAKYGGIVSFTGGLIGHVINEEKYHGKFEGTKVFMGNSDRDPHVPLSRSEESKAVMEGLGANVTLKIYPGMPHTIIPEEISWVKHNIF